MNTRNMIILIVVVAIVIFGVTYYLGNQEAPAPETPTITTSPSPDDTPDSTPDTQPTTDEPGQQN